MDDIKADDWLSSKSKVGLKDIVPVEPREYAMMHPKDMRVILDKVTRAIDRATKDRQKMSRVKWILNWEKIFLEFSQWSHIFNKELRKRIAETKDETEDKNTMDLYTKYTYVYSYWWNRMHYISTILASKSRLAGGSVKKGLERGRVTLSRLIDGEVDFSQLSEDFQKLIASHQSFDFADALQHLLSIKKGDK